MKLACTSSAFADAIQRGDLTQLEFLDYAARELRSDGVVLDVLHFPRTDDDYLAQVKKMAVDYGQTIAALWSADAFAPDAARQRALLSMARTLGAPLLAGPLASETALSWAAQAQSLGEAAQSAKASNVVLAVRNAAGTFAASSADCKRVSKETDSAWLRFGLDPAAFDGASNALDLSERVVLLWSGDASPSTFIAEWGEFHGFTVVESREKSAHRTWRRALSEFELNRT